MTISLSWSEYKYFQKYGWVGFRDLEPEDKCVHGRHYYDPAVKKTRCKQCKEIIK